MRASRRCRLLGIVLGLIFWQANSEAATAQPPAAVGDSYTVTVERVSPEGVLSPLEDWPVFLELWQPGPMGGAPVLSDRVWRALSDGGGTVRFGPLVVPPKGQLRASLRYRGASFSSPFVSAGQSRQLSLRVYERGASLEQLKSTLILDLRVEEEVLVIRQRIFLRNESLELVDLDQTRLGLRVPLLLPSVFGESPDPGLVPGKIASRHMKVEVSPRLGRIVFERGGVYYRGQIPPGQLDFSVAFTIPIVAEMQELAIRSPTAVERVYLSVESTDRAIPRVVPLHPIAHLRQTEARERWGASWQLKGGLESEQSLRIQVDGLVLPKRTVTRLAIGGGLLCFAIFALATAAGVIRRRRARAGGPLSTERLAERNRHG